LELDLGYKFFVGVNEWRKILGFQDQLKHLKWSLAKPLESSVSLPAVSLSASNLTTLQLGLKVVHQDQQTYPLDCSVFEPCLNLKMLVLVNDLPCDSRPATKDIFNLHQLPQSIEALAVENFLIETSEVEKVFFSYPAIKKISLERIGITGDFGMTFPLITKILARTQLTEIIIREFNGDECELHLYDHLIQLGLKLPLKTAFFHVTFFKHFMEYMAATSPEYPDYDGMMEQFVSANDVDANNNTCPSAAGLL
jgi:hypothetical protein